MRSLLILGLLAALLAPGSSLSCEECFSLGGPCSGPVLPCSPGEEACVSGIVHYTLEGRTLLIAFKSCLEPGSCRTMHLSLTFRPGVTIRGNVTCCHEDSCNTGVAELPSVSSVPNGRLCPSCYVEGAGQCKRVEPLPCTGAEDHCVEVTGTLSAGNVSLTKAAEGCGTPGACQKRIGVTKYARGIFDTLTRAVCYPAPHGEL